MTTHRPYLHTEDRRDSLLDAFGRLLDQHSLAGIKMIEVAEEAGVSRALLYKHFPDLGSLVQAYFEDRSARYFEIIDAQPVPILLSTTGAMSGISAISSLPIGELRAIEVLLASRLDPELDAVRERFREVFLQRWDDVVRNARDPRLAEAMVWTLLGPALSLSIAVKTEQTTLDEAERIWQVLLVGPAEMLNPTG
jgi:AcrR family transcriptional regulator